MIKAETPSPKSADYQQKSLLIESLPLHPDRAISELGEQLLANPLISNKQLGLLLAELKQLGILHYKRDYDESFLTRTEKDREVLITSFDKAKYDIENNGKIQAQLICTLAGLSKSSTLSSRINLVTGLFNFAHRSTKNIDWTQGNKVDFTTSQKSLEKTEEDIFKNRHELASAMQDAHIINDADAERIRDLSEVEFRELSSEQDLYDQFLSLYFLDKLPQAGVTQQFIALQEIAYCGYALGITQLPDRLGV